jgi:hypothetical protein
MSAQREISTSAKRPEVARLYADIASEMPDGWELQGLQCTSTGLQPHLRGSDWLAEACGPAGECIKVEARDPAEALVRLAGTLQLHCHELH